MLQSIFLIIDEFENEGDQFAGLVAKEILYRKYILHKELPGADTIDNLVEQAQNEALGSPIGSFYRL